MKEFCNQDLKEWNSFRTGGIADIIYLPESQNELIALANSLHYNFYVIGSGTNLLISDKGIKKPIICTKGLVSHKVENQEVIAEAGVRSETVAKIFDLLIAFAYSFFINEFGLKNPLLLLLLYPGWGRVKSLNFDFPNTLYAFTLVGYAPPRACSRHIS
ncbi:unnamed protein product [marine sediment metagenome]|uniref:FAD-binding PCMH-type domain-containing protein n=1 Tax=marine sediment metagenome TaxID=412755 RepID=X1G125_9ZZZZ